MKAMLQYTQANTVKKMVSQSEKKKDFREEVIFPSPQHSAILK